MADTKRRNSKAQLPRKQPTILRESAGEGAAAGSNDGDIQIGRKWAVEPGVGRVANGIPKRVDRLRGLGNAIVPQVAEVIFRAIDQAR